MADLQFTIGFRDDGTPVLRNFKREVEGLGTTAHQASTKASGSAGAMARAFGGLQGVIAGIGFTHLAAEAVQMADTAKLISGRLSLVTASQEELTHVQDALFASAQRTRSSYEGTVDLYTRLARNAQGLGASQADLLQVTESINKAMQISGTTGASAQAALVQLGQGFASGTLRGEELNSVLEQTPRLAEAIAVGMGVTVGQLRQLGQDGELTAKAVFDALKSQGAVIDEEFGKLPVTVGGALTEINNALLKFVGVLDEATGVTGLLAQGMHNWGRVIDAVAEKLRANTMAEDLRELMVAAEHLQQQVDQLRANPSWVERVFNVPVLRNTEMALALVTKRAQELSNQLQGRKADGTMFTQISDAAFYAATAVDAFRVKVVALTPEQVKLQEAIQKQLGTLKDQEAQIRLSARAFVEYQAAQLKGKGYTDAEIAQWKAYSLAILAAKERKEAATKATRDQADASRKAEAETRRLEKAEADLVREEERMAEGILDIVDALRKEAVVRAERLARQQEEITQLEEEGRLLQASLGPKDALLQLEKEIAIAREDRATATALAGTQEEKLGEAEQANIRTAGELRKKNIDLADSNRQIAAAQKNALLTTQDLREGFRDMLDALLDGDWSGALDVLERKGKELGARLIEGIAFGKEDLENDVLIPNFEHVFGKGGIVGGILQEGGSYLGKLFGQFFSAGVQSETDGLLEEAIGSQAMGSSGGIFGGAGTGQGDFGLFGGIFGGAGGASKAGAADGTAAGGAYAAAGYAGIALALAQAGKDFSKGKYGSGGGAVVGGAIAGYFSVGNPQAIALGAMIGRFLGSFLDPLFKHIPTKGSRIRASVKDYLKEIGASFAKEIDSADYFFEETKKLANRLFGGDGAEEFLKASKIILTEKAGPELARQLQALGTALTADQAIELDKNVEQTGTTFGNMLVKNLGIDKIPEAIAEIVQKGDFTFANLTDKLTEVFQKNAIGVEFYKETLQGAVSLFYGDLPEAIHAAEIALRSFTDGAFDLAKFEGALEEAIGRYDAVGASLGQALANGIASGQSRAEVEAAFATLLKDALRTALIQKFVTDELETLFAGIDLSQPIDAGSEAFVTLRERAGDAYDRLLAILDAAGLLPDALKDSVAGADALVARIRQLQAEIQAVANQRIEIRLQLLDDLVSIGLVTALDAIAERIQSIQERITALIASAPPRGRDDGPFPISTLSDADLNSLIQLNEQLRQAILSRYQQEAAAIQAAAQAQIAAIREEYAAKRAAIQADFAARRAAIQAEFAARREAIQATISQLQEQRNATRTLYQEQIEALQEQLAVAQQFAQVVESITGIIRAAALSAQSPLAPQQQLGFLQREEAALRAQLATATGAERARLMQELAQLLQQQLQFVDRNTVNGQQLFTGILAELNALREAAAQEADKAALLQARIAAATLAMDLALKSIDAQIAQQQALLSDLSKQEQAQLAALAAQEQALLTALAAQEQAAIHAVEETARQQLEALRATTAAELTALAIQQDQAAQEQLRRLEAQLATAREQLITAVGAEEAARLLAAGDQAHLILMAQNNATLHSIEAILIRTLNALETDANAAPQNQQQQEQAALSGPVPLPIRPATTSGTSTGTSATPLSFTFAPVVTVTSTGGEGKPGKADIEETLRVAEQRFKRLMETDWAPTIRRVAEGGV